MAENKLELNSPEGGGGAENVLVQVMTIQLTKDNYLQCSAAITMGIVGRGRSAYIVSRKPPLLENDPLWKTLFFEDNQVKM